MKNKNLRKGFTLIELLVVIAIIGILSSFVLSNFQDARARARDGKRKTDLNEVRTALRMYYNDNEVYPATGSLSWGNQFGTTSIYMKKLPQDPLGSPSYYYEQVDAGDGFNLYACLENSSDSDGTSSCGASGCSWCFVVSQD